MKGTIFDIKELAVHDGPGVRVTVFFKGCPLRCQWCHNPEGMSASPQIYTQKERCAGCGRCKAGCDHEECLSVVDNHLCTKICPHGLISVCGRRIDSIALTDRLRRYEDILTGSGGGITISGGEPLMQPKFLLELLQALKPMHTAVETSGYGEPEAFRQVVNTADLVLFDIKHSSSAVHKKYTGVGNGLILSNLKLLIASGRAFVARLPLIPGVNDTEQNMKAVAKLLLPAKGHLSVELLPFNPLAGAKYDGVNMTFSSNRTSAEADISGLLKHFADQGLPCRCL